MLRVLISLWKEFRMHCGFLSCDRLKWITAIYFIHCCDYVLFWYCCFSGWATSFFTILNTPFSIDFQTSVCNDYFADLSTVIPVFFVLKETKYQKNIFNFKSVQFFIFFVFVFERNAKISYETYMASLLSSAVPYLCVLKEENAWKKAFLKH